MRDVLKKLGGFFFGVLISLIVLEFFLRVYNPIETRLKGYEIVLPVNKQYVIRNSTFPRLDPIIIHNKNSLGFRGEKLPEDLANYLSIIMVGGSTTEEFYLSDDSTWSYLLAQSLKKHFSNVWVNNAGFDGHSTFGHQILLDKYLTKIKPKYIFYLVGLTDIERDNTREDFDSRLLKDNYVNWFDFFGKKSEVANLILNFGRAIKARRLNMGHLTDYLKSSEKLIVSVAAINSELVKQTKYLNAYQVRLVQLIESSRSSGITPVLLTQPLLWGEVTDPTTGYDLGNVKIKENQNGKLYWLILEKYNEVTRAVSREHDVFLIDLAKEMPKDSLYYYDGIHFSKQGAKKIAEIIYNNFQPSF